MSWRQASVFSPNICICLIWSRPEHMKIHLSLCSSQSFTPAFIWEGCSNLFAPSLSISQKGLQNGIISSYHAIPNSTQSRGKKAYSWGYSISPNYPTGNYASVFPGPGAIPASSAAFWKPRVTEAWKGSWKLSHAISKAPITAHSWELMPMACGCFTLGHLANAWRGNLNH